MAGACGDRIGVEPSMWFLIFATSAKQRWLSWLAMGRFKHVLALGWVADQRVWVIYEVSIGRTRVAVLPACAGASEMIAELRAGNVTVAMAPGRQGMRWLQPGFWCVPAMAHLVGLRTWAMRPDALYRACLAQGGSLVEW